MCLKLPCVGEPLQSGAQPVCDVCDARAGATPGQIPSGVFTQSSCLHAQDNGIPHRGSASRQKEGGASPGSGVRSQLARWLVTALSGILLVPRPQIPIPRQRSRTAIPRGSSRRRCSPRDRIASSTCAGETRTLVRVCFSGEKGKL